MAFDRKSFKNRLLGTLGGAITHYYMVKLAELNKQTKWVQHWNKEVDRLINMDLVVTVVSEIKGRWDKRKAIAECLADIKAADRRYRTVAANYVAKVYKLKKINKQLAAEVDRPFYETVHETVEAALRSSAED
jgi:hypothetical protein